jgi:uncharacterized protein YodC (DUF2158 family)
MAEQLAPGVVVKLKSGGPAMTIVKKMNAIGVDEGWQCRWFDTKGQLQTHTFMADELMVHVDEGPFLA